MAKFQSKYDRNWREFRFKTIRVGDKNVVRLANKLMQLHSIALKFEVPFEVCLQLWKDRFAFQCICI